MSATVSAVGMVTALGLDWKTSCAASRAGISRAARLDYFTFRTQDTGALVSAVGHSARLITQGFEHYGRLVRLLAGAMRDLRHSSGEGNPILSRAKYYLSLPDPARLFLSSALIADLPTREQYQRAEEEARRLSASSQSEQSKKLFLHALRLAGVSEIPELAATSSVGHAGVGVVMDKALADLSTGAADAVVVGGVDSLLDEDTLGWLLNTGRLKSPALAAGLMPGEAAALLLLTRDGASGPITVTRVVRGEDGQSLSSGGAPTGAALGRAIAEAVGTEAQPAVLYSDHNGEQYRATEFGYVALRLQALRPWIMGVKTMFPAQSFGDTGAASGAVALAVLTSRWSRPDSEETLGAVTSSSDGPERAVMVAELGRLNSYKGASARAR